MKDIGLSCEGQLHSEESSGANEDDGAEFEGETLAYGNEAITLAKISFY